MAAVHDLDDFPFPHPEFFQGTRRLILSAVTRLGENRDMVSTLSRGVGRERKGDRGQGNQKNKGSFLWLMDARSSCRNRHRSLWK